MINKIKSILRGLCNNIEGYEVTMYSYSSFVNKDNYYIQFSKNDFKYKIVISEDIKLGINSIKDTTIGSDYKISIPAEEVQEINMLCSILLNSCVEYTKNKFNEINL